MNLQIQADCFNTSDTPIFSSPSSTFRDAAFGTITSVASKPRAFELANHFNF